VRQEADSGLPLCLEAAQWGACEAQTFQALQGTEPFAPANILRLRDQACVAPEPVSQTLAKQPYIFEVLEHAESPRPAWLSKACHRRKLFEGAVLRFTVQGENQAAGDCRLVNGPCNPPQKGSSVYMFLVKRRLGPHAFQNQPVGNQS